MKKINLVTGCVLALFLLSMAMFSSLTAHGTSTQDTEVEMEEYVYSTFFGGTNEDIVKKVVTDSQGSIIVAGSTYSTDFPILNAYQDTYGGGDKPEDYHVFGGDGFVAKFNPAGQLTWSTFLGGSNMDCIHALAVDSSDNIIAIGTSNSTDFPVTADAYQSSYAGGAYDITITTFAPDGSLIYSSYLGSPGHDESRDFELDSSGNLVITGGTSSAAFPLTADAADKIYEGDAEGFLTIIGPDYSTLVYSSFFGGSGYEGGDEIAIDNQGNIIVTGATMSQDFPVTDDAYQDTINGTERDFFVAKFSSNYQLTYATYFGGSHMDDCFGMTVDSAGNIILTGRTWSSDFPTKNAYQEDYAGLTMEGVDGFLTKLSADGQNLIFSTYIGGSYTWDTVFNPVIDANDNVIVTLLAGAGFNDFPVINGLQANAGVNYEVLIIKMSPTGDLLFSSYLGGISNEHPRDQFMVDGTIYIVGETTSHDFLITGDAYQEHYMGGTDGFIFRLELSDYLDDLDTVESSTNGTANSTPGFELPLVLIGLVSLLVMSRRSGRKHP